MRRALLALLVLLTLSVGLRAGETARDLQRLVSSGGPAAGSFGVHVVDVRTGEAVFSVAATKPRIPASAMKLFTSGTAWLSLGEKYRFETKALGAGKPDGRGVLAGDLVIVGGGDPTLSVEPGEGGEPGSVDDLAARIARSGVRRVAGNLVLDDSRFDRVLRHPTWPADQLRKWYCAPVAGLTAARSCVKVVVRPGAAAGEPAVVTLEPASSAFSLVNKITTTAVKSEQKIIADLRPAEGLVRASGKIWTKSLGYDAEVAVPDPTIFFGHVLYRALVRAGVSVEGEVVADRGGLGRLTSPVLLARVETPLLDVLGVMNLRSQNLFAECVLKTLGAVRTGEGSFEAGAAVTRALAGEIGIPAPELVQIDGSGLSRDNRASPRAFTRLLTHIFETGDPVPFMGTLPAGGAEIGSLRKRMGDLAGNVRAKTGTIRGVSALAGYVRSESDRIFAFAVLINDARMPLSKARQFQDEVCRILRRGQ